MPIVLNKRSLKDADEGVYVGRPTIWGNPFEIGKSGSREQVIDEYRLWLHNSPKLLSRIPELKGKNLICWCSPLPCHADILLDLANPKE